MTVMQMLTYASPAVLVAGGCIGAYFYRVLDPVHKWIVWYIAVMLGVDITSRVMAIVGGNNLMVLLLYSLIELVMFQYLYHKLLLKKKHIVIGAFGAVAVLYIIYELIVFTDTDIKNFQSYSKVADNFIVIIMALAFFLERITMYRDSKFGHFVLNAVILTFFVLSLIIFLPFNFLVNEATGMKFYFWQGVLVITILFYIYLAYSVWLQARLTKKALKG